MIDMHIHSNYSDGKLTPFEIIDRCIKNNVNKMSITDHDTVEAYSDELFDYCKNNNIEIITGVEISTRYNKKSIHVLGYNIDINNKELINKLETLRNSRHDYLYKVGTKLKELGYFINVEELDKVDSVTKAHIALDIINNKKNYDLLNNTFGHIPNKGEFIETLMNENCVAYVEKLSISPKEAAEIIRKAGGKVVLAHPVAYEFEDGLNDEDILNIINEMNADGIEANYIYVDKNNRKHNEIRKWNSFAKKHNLNVTIGSDFHKDDGIRSIIGFTNEKYELLDKDAKEIVNWILK